MKAVLYKDLQQIRHNTAMLITAVIAIVAPLSLIATITPLAMGPDMAGVMLRFAVASFTMGLAPTLALDAIRSDFVNGTIVSVRACGRPFRQYLAAQLAYAVVPITVLSAALMGFAFLDAPALRPTIAGPQGVALTVTPTLAALALYLWSIFIKGKAMIMTTTTLDSIAETTSAASAPVTSDSAVSPLTASDSAASGMPSASGTAAVAPTGPTPLAIRVTDMTFGYRRRKPVLEHIDLDVPAGQSLGILGYNGVGKTTLFGVITGLLRPQTGSATINEAVFHSMREVFQLTDSGNLSPTMTIRENLRFRSMLYATHDDQHPLDLKHLDRLPMVRAFELGEHLDKKVKDLSSGLRKRAGIMAGMLFDPRLILLDEPTNAVDPVTRQLLIDLMRQLKADGRTILTITHDLDYCWEVADRVIVLDDKRVVKDCLLADFGDIDAFRQAATLGRERDHVDFGLGGAR
ncbi:ATP-binding protein of ABC transporter system [Bifidobacterium myosotis]|uniref:ATP-binding protein of ABC transporter system n=1 Tax=Bifidobacterium myosotis TaxID=1630166 RepID=A0A261FGF9_9BIFI|nr:ATP-binding cassette domain-containing protein [Bifidobacterium myosotis]OZG58224.1 ATP-binding protein of ABC transporter system [Bifidobacterium myosotis]